VEIYVKRPKEGTVIADGQPPFIYEQACQDGEGINERNERIVCVLLRRALRLFNNNTTGAEEYSNPESSPYRIKTYDGTPFPFDSRFGFVWKNTVTTPGQIKVRKEIDLVVGKVEYVSPLETLEDFDLNICKCNFNGDTFSIPDPLRTFDGQTTFTSKRTKDLILGYHTHFNGNNMANENETGRDERQHQIRHALELVQEDGVLLSCKLIGADECNSIIIRRRRNQHFALHNYIVRQVERIKKYEARGIVVEDDDNLIDATNEFQIRRINQRPW
jgi:hypothetical protein